MLSCAADILASIAEARIDSWRETTEDIDDRKYADLATGGELILNEVHCRGLIDLTRLSSILAQLCFHATLLAGSFTISLDSAAVVDM